MRKREREKGYKRNEEMRETGGVRERENVEGREEEKDKEKKGWSGGKTGEERKKSINGVEMEMSFL
jgi:hypothetical protein